MKNWINKIIDFLRFLFFGKMPKRNIPTPNPEWRPEVAPTQPGIVADSNYKVGQLNTRSDGTTSVVSTGTMDGKVEIGILRAGSHVISSESKPKNVSFQVIRYMEQKGYHIDRTPGNGNIVYISGMKDFYGNTEDEWDDIRLIIRFDGTLPYIDFSQSASTEPGKISRRSDAAKQLGGVATVVPGQYKSWKMGYHKHDFDHPALVQCANVTIWRDSNADAKFENEMMFDGIFGINQHSTMPNFEGNRVGAWSAGCLVARNFEMHLEFINKLKQWDCYKNDPDCRFWTTIIPGQKLWTGKGI